MMRVAVMGSGSLGAFYGMLLAKAGHDVTFIARGAHLEAIRANGLTLKSETFGDTTLPVSATNDTSSIGKVDLVIFAVKTYDLDPAAEQIIPVVGQDTMVLPLQNGVNAAERLAAYVPQETLLGGLSWVSARIEAPGVVRHAMINRMQFGELAGGSSARVEQLHADFTAAGIGAELDQNIRLALWVKFMIFCPGSSLCSLIRLPYAPILATPESSALFKGIMDEVGMIARAKNVPLTQERIDDRYATSVQGAKNADSPSIYPSMYYDLIAGRRIEIDATCGYIWRQGQVLGIPTPVSQFAYSALKPYINGTPEMLKRVV